MLYFAYGSNMDRAQMQERCRSARFVCTAKLEGHRLVFPRKSRHRKRKCGVASVERSDGSDVWGVVYQIDELDIATLDEREGYDVNLPADQNSYLRKKTRVLRDGYEEQAIAVWTYEANPKPTPPPPSAEYKGLIVEAAKFWRLPPDYIAELERIETKG